MVEDLRASMIFETTRYSKRGDENIDVPLFRSSFTTHPLEADLNLGYIQELSVPVYSITTEIYTRVSTKNFFIIKSLDSLFQGAEYEQRDKKCQSGGESYMRTVRISSQFVGIFQVSVYKGVVQNSAGTYL